MAKRKRLEAPSADALKEIEEGFARETSGNSALGPMPPIAQVAGEAAAGSSALGAEERLKAVRDSTDAERYRKALAEGLIVEEIRIIDIHSEALARDRVNVDAEEMEELKASIRAHGLRLPIEVYPNHQSSEADVPRYGLISGWRRLMAVRDLMVEARGEDHTKIKAIVRAQTASADSYVAMVEENEIRSDLSQYERGRIAVMAAGQGAFGSVEEAVNALFHAGSKAKRSKIRAFAELHEELGDLLSHAHKLSERQGLRVVAAIRAGLTTELRRSLETGQISGFGSDAAGEWALLEPVVLDAEALDKPAKAPGRPRAKSRDEYGEGVVTLANGITLKRETDARGYCIRLEGGAVNAELLDVVMQEIRRVLEAK